MGDPSLPSLSALVAKLHRRVTRISDALATLQGAIDAMESENERLRAELAAHGSASSHYGGAARTDAA